ncbi:MAG: glycosyltransferase, partial [Promethearchaeota archaeon]
MLTERFFPEIGGVEKHSLEISKRIVRDGHKLTIITRKTPKSANKYEKIDGINIVRIAANGYLPTWLNLSKFCMNFSRYDIIHCHDFVTFYWIFPFIFFNRNLYITFHGFERYPIPKIYIILRKIAEIFTKRNICVGRFISSYYKTKPNYITYGGIDLNEKENLITTKSNFNTQNLKKLLFIGRLEKDTGILYYIEALKILKFEYRLNLELDICGEGRLENMIRSYSKKNNLTVNFNGFISNLGKFFEKSGIIFSSSYLSIIESLYRKKLVISVYHNKLKEDYLKLSPFSKYIIVCKNSIEIAESIFNIINNNIIYEEKIEQGYLFAKQHTWNDVYKLYKELWKL